MNNSKSRCICWFVAGDFLHVYRSNPLAALPKGALLRCRQQYLLFKMEEGCVHGASKTKTMIYLFFLTTRLLFHPLLAPAAASSNPRRAPLLSFSFFLGAVTISTLFSTLVTRHRGQRSNQASRKGKGGWKRKADGREPQQISCFRAERAAFHYG